MWQIWVMGPLFMILLWILHIIRIIVSFTYLFCFIVSFANVLCQCVKLYWLYFKIFIEIYMISVHRFSKENIRTSLPLKVMKGSRPQTLWWSKIPLFGVSLTVLAFNSKFYTGANKRSNKSFFELSLRFSITKGVFSFYVM